MAFILHDTATETTSGIGDPISVSNALIGMFVNISASSGTLPTLIVKLQHSLNGEDWYDVSGVVTGSLAGISLTSIIPNAQQNICDTVRVVWTIDGVSPHFTFKAEVATVGG